MHIWTFVSRFVTSKVLHLLGSLQLSEGYLELVNTLKKDYKSCFRNFVFSFQCLSKGSGKTKNLY